MGPMVADLHMKVKKRRTEIGKILRKENDICKILRFNFKKSLSLSLSV